MPPAFRLLDGDFVWTPGSLCQLQRLFFDPALLLRQFPPSYDLGTLLNAAKTLEFKVGKRAIGAKDLAALPLPCAVFVKPDQGATQAHRTARWLNNRAENSHEPIRERKRRMRGFKSPGHVQRFLSVFGVIASFFRPGRHLLAAVNYREIMHRRFTQWRELVCLQPTIYRQCTSSETVLPTRRLFQFISVLS